MFSSSEKANGCKVYEGMPRDVEEDLKTGVDLQPTDSIATGAIPEESFPDGGIKAWLTVGGGFLSFIASIGFLNGGAVFQSYYTTTTLSAYTPSDVAWIGSIQLWGCFFFGIWAGHLSDRYGPKLPLAVGTFFIVLGNMMASISTKYYQYLLSQGFCVALGTGLAFTPALAVQSQWFLKGRGFTVGLVMSGQNVGGVVWSVLVNNLLNERGLPLGWSLRIIAFMQLAIMVVAMLLVQPRFRRGHAPSQAISLPGALKRYVTDKRTLLYTLGMVLVNLGIYVPWFYVSVFASQVGASSRMAFYDASILNAGAFFGCYALGLVADFGLGLFNCLAITTIACGIAALGWIGVTADNAGTIIWIIIYGLLSGAVQAIYSPCLSSLAPTPEVIGRWNGICISFLSFSALATGPVAGQLLTDGDYTNYLPMQLFTGFTLLVAGSLFGILRFWVSRDTGGKARV